MPLLVFIWTLSTLPSIHNISTRRLTSLLLAALIIGVYFKLFRQHKLRFLMEWHSYLHPWIWMNHVGGRWNNIYSSKLGTFIQKCSNTISRFESILAISSTLKLGIYLWNFPLYRFRAINCQKINADPYQPEPAWSLKLPQNNPS
jgi:hypothetical protein